MTVFAWLPCRPLKRERTIVTGRARGVQSVAKLWLRSLFDRRLDLRDQGFWTELQTLQRIFDFTTNPASAFEKYLARSPIDPTVNRTVLPDGLRFMPMTLLILTAMVSCYIQFYGLLRLRPVK